MCTLYKTLLECFIKKTVIQQMPISLININDPQNYLPLEEIYMGAKILAILRNKHFDSQQPCFANKMFKFLCRRRQTNTKTL